MFRSLKQLPYLKPYYISAFLGEIYFIIPIWLFFYLRVINYQQAALLTIIQAITTVILEIPTGALADVVGKRITLIISFGVWALTLLMYVFANSFIFFVVLEVVKGFAKAMYSGTFEAIVYDTLLERKDEQNYTQVIADFTTLSWVGLFISAYTGGILYELHPFIPYALTSFVYLLLAYIFIRYIHEPKIDTEEEEISLRRYIKQNVQGVHELFKDKYIGVVSFALIIVSLGYYVASEFLGISQARDYGLQPIHVGLLFGSGYIISATFSQLFPRLKNRFSNRTLFALSVAVLATSFLFAKFIGPVLGGVLILSRISSSTIFVNLKSTIVNSYISSKNRATALSTMSLMMILPYSILLIFGGPYIDRTSPNQFAFIWGLIFTSLITSAAVVRLIIVTNKENDN